MRGKIKKIEKQQEPSFISLLLLSLHCNFFLFFSFFMDDMLS